MRPVTDVAGAEWARERGSLVDVGLDDGDSLLLPFSPVRFSSMSAGTHGKPAWQGQHNRDVLREILSLDDDDIAKLEADRVIVERRPG
jgi:crotonobetainyl-CoA:carnitine CoA-transferase CaiB-like acyl-CoA transferase